MDKRRKIVLDNSSRIMRAISLKSDRSVFEAIINETIEEAINFTDSSAELPTKEEINLAANECSDINGIICEDEYWVIAKNDGFKEGADFVINKLK